MDTYYLVHKNSKEPLDSQDENRNYFSDLIDALCFAVGECDFALYEICVPSKTPGISKVINSWYIEKKI